MKLEICANSFQAALNAQKAGADRIELCTELSVGGVTPSIGLLKKVAQEISIPVHGLIRPRSGDFCYSDAEFEQMKTDIKICKKLGLQGIVSGILNENNTIDIQRTRELIELSRPLSFTFHRAFDCVINPKKSLSDLIKLQVDRILTSGQKEKAVQGVSLLIELKKIAAENVIILPGSGINVTNINQFKKFGFTEVHSSASKAINSNVFFDKTPQTVSDYETIKELVKLAKNE